MPSELASDRPLRPFRTGAIVVMVIGVVLFVAGLIIKINVPSNDGFMQGRISIDDVGHNNAAEFRGIAMMMFGAFMALGGSLAMVATSRSLRRAGYAITTEATSAIAAGLDNTERRLARIEQLRASGVLTEDEYTTKRAEIIKKL